MRYHLFLNSARNMVKTTKVFSRKLAVNFQSSTTVHGGSVSKKYNSNNLAFRKGYDGPPATCGGQVPFLFHCIRSKVFNFLGDIL